jgi:hypothetical protein
MKRAPLERFLEHIERQPNGCWFWRGPLAGLMIDGVQQSPRQLAWTLMHRGVAPIRPLITTCGHDNCVRIGHLRMCRTDSAPHRAGVRLPATTITTIRRLRETGWKLSTLSKRFGISISGVSRICTKNRRSAA